ncbi:MAG: PAS domain-containing protein [Longimicrobiales bacterium]|nr:PAS domain-containing protein [Longimicrobiales bacterium]
MTDPEKNTTRLDAVLANYPFGGAVAIYDTDYRYLLIRGRGWEELDVDAEHAVGRSFGEIWEPEVASLLEEMADGAFGGRTVVRRIALGRRVHEVVSVPLDREPEPEGIFFSRDVTEESGWEAMQGHLLASVPAAVAAVDLDGRIVYWNAEAERLLGYAASEVMGRSRCEIEERVLRPEAREILDRLEEGDEWEAELPLVDRDGARRRVLFKSTSIHDERGEKVGVMGIGEDLTAHRAMEERLERLGRLDSLGRMAAGVAHDFANLLSVLQGGLDLLEENVCEPDRPVLRDMQQSVRKGVQLTRQLLAVGRADPGAPGCAHVGRVLEEIRDLLRRSIPERIALDVIAGAGDAVVALGGVKLEQILLNLTMNARDAIEGEGEITIEVARRPAGNEGAREVSIRVSDTGHGIDPGLVDHIFEPFVTTRGEEGTGLGLATVYGLVRQVGGTVEIPRTGPDGTTFEVRLPEV